MPRTASHSRALIKRFREISDPSTRYVDMCLRFKIANGVNKGRLTRPYGGIFDTKASQGLGKFVSFYDPNIKAFTGDTPKKIVVREISNQQLPFITNFYSRIILALGGRRSGKSAAVGFRIAVMLVVFNGAQGVVISPTYRQANNVFKAVRRALPRGWVKKGRAGYSKSDHKLTLINNASVIFLSADNPNSPRSEGSAWVVLDERQEIKEEAYRNAYFSQSEGRGFESIAETATINPGLRDHYDVLMADPDATVCKMSTWDNPWIDKKILEKAESLIDKETRQRELEAEWPEPVGRIYYPFQYDSHVRQYPAADKEDATAALMHNKFDTPDPSFVNDAKEFFVSIDPPHHAVVWKIYDDDTMHAIDEIIVCEDANGLNRPADVRDLAEQVKARYSRSVIVYDPHETKHMSDVRRYFGQRGFRVVKLKRLPIEDRITAVRARLERDKILIDPRCKRLTEALLEHLYDENFKPKKTQKFKGSNFLTMDHIADAFGYGVYKLYPARANINDLLT